jgi:hypothetical protein
MACMGEMVIGSWHETCATTVSLEFLELKK